MPGQDDINSPADRARNDGKEQPRLSRRSVLRGAAGAGAAGLAATALAGPARPAFAATSAAAHHTKASGPGHGHLGTIRPPHVRDARSGEIDVFRGTSQTRRYATRNWPPSWCARAGDRPSPCPSLH